MHGLCPLQLVPALLLVAHTLMRAWRRRASFPQRLARLHKIPGSESIGMTPAATREGEGRPAAKAAHVPMGI